jgi:hypothetical protein
MRSSVRLIVIIALAVAFVLVPEVRRQPAGEALAVPPPPADFTLGSTKAEVTHETANQCLPPGTFISCLAPYFDSDSYQVNASVNASAPVDLDTDVTQNPLVIEFKTGTCAAPGDVISLQIIPGNAVHKTSNNNFTIYSFEGNVPRLFEELLFDHLEMNLKIPVSTPANSTLHIEANTNFCDFHLDGVVWDGTPGTPVTGPVAMYFDIGSFFEKTPDATPDNDRACVNVTPEYNTLDISSAFCSLG